MKHYDTIYINENGNQYQVNFYEVDGDFFTDKRITYIMFKKTPEDKGFKLFFDPSWNDFNTEREAYINAQEIIRNDYK